MERLDRVLVQLGLGSRKEVRALVRQRRVTVDGAPATDPAQPVDPARQSVAVDGEALAYHRHLHLMLHKPAGVVTAARDARHGTVLDLVPPAYRRRDLQPVGRLDRDTGGLLILTTDGELNHRLTSPRRHVDKLYRAHLDAPVDAGDVAAFAAGLILADGTACLPARLEPLPGTAALVTVVEGRYHQVKRMFAARDRRVVALARLQVGPLALDPNLAPGAVRPLTAAEVTALYAAVALNPTPP